MLLARGRGTLLGMFVYSRSRSGRVELLGECDTHSPNLAVEAVVGKIILELLAMDADTTELLASLRKCDLIATEGDSFESASPYRPEK